VRLASLRQLIGWLTAEITVLEQVSADLGEPANIAGLRLDGCSDLTLTLLDAVDPARGKILELEDCTRITLAALVVAGDLQANIDGLDAIGVNLKGCTATCITGCDFSGLARGLVMSDLTDTTLAANSFHLMVADGASGGQMHRLWVVGNSFTQWRSFEGGHPDPVQITRTEQGSPSSDIYVIRNYFNTGGGSQGFHVGRDSEAYRHTNITVAGNIFVQGPGPTNQVNISLTDGVRVGGNAVIWPVGSPQPFIRMQDNTDQIVSGNRSGGYMPEELGDGEDNIVLAQMLGDEVEDEVVNWSAMALAGKVLAP